MRRALLAGVIAIVIVAFMGCSSSSSGSPGGNRVTMTDSFAYEPKEITVAPGDTITFENTSSNVHTVTAVQDSLPPGADYFASGGFSSEMEARDHVADGLLQGGDTFKLTLDQQGTYQYFCIPHESSGMQGTIIVKG